MEVSLVPHPAGWNTRQNNPHPKVSSAPSQGSSDNKLLFLHEDFRSVTCCMGSPKASLHQWEKVGRLTEAGLMLTLMLGTHARPPSQQ